MAFLCCVLFLVCLFVWFCSCSSFAFSDFDSLFGIPAASTLICAFLSVSRIGIFLKASKVDVSKFIPDPKPWWRCRISFPFQKRSSHHIQKPARTRVSQQVNLRDDPIPFFFFPPLFSFISQSSKFIGFREFQISESFGLEMQRIIRSGGKKGFNFYFSFILLLMIFSSLPPYYYYYYYYYMRTQ